METGWGLLKIVKRLTLKRTKYMSNIIIQIPFFFSSLGNDGTNYSSHKTTVYWGNIPGLDIPNDSSVTACQSLQSMTINQGKYQLYHVVLKINVSSSSCILPSIKVLSLSRPI